MKTKASIFGRRIFVIHTGLIVSLWLFFFNIYVAAQSTSCNSQFSYYIMSNPDSVHFYPTGTSSSFYYWHFGDGSFSTSQYPWHYYSQPDDYYACLTTLDSISGDTCTWCDSIHIAATVLCNAHFVHYSVSNPDSIHFYPSANGASSYYWQFGDGATSSILNPWHLYAQPGDYYACLTIVLAASGDTCTWCDSIHIAASPMGCNSQFSYYIMSNPDSIHFYPTGTASTFYYWHFGDGTVSTAHYPWHYYTQPGDYYACLTTLDSISGDTCTWCDSIHIAGSPTGCNSQFSYYIMSNPDSLHFYPTGTASTFYYWHFGDSTYSTVHYPLHYFTQPGDYYVCLTTIDSLSGDTCTWCDSIHIAASPTGCHSQFSYYVMSNPDSVHFYPTGTASTFYYWHFGDGTFSTSHYPWHYYTQPGDYYACLTTLDSISGDTCTWCDSIHIAGPSPCSAQFAHYSMSNPDSIHFYPTSTVASLYYWQFGDGSTSTSQSPWHYYTQSGVYYVCLTMILSSSGDTCTWCDSLLVPSPAAGCNTQFSYYILSNPDSVHFYPTGPASNFHHWYFGDSTYSTMHYPWHYYLHPGDYYSCLTTIDSISGDTCTWCDSVHARLANPVFEIVTDELVIKAYPNPADKTFILSAEGTSRNRSVFIYDFSGRVVYRKSGIPGGILEISTAEFVSGVYCFVISEEASASVRGKFVVLH